VKRLLVRPRIALDDVELVGVRMSEVIEPGRFVEADDVDDERIAFPAADG
jgi:hypothetical protein